MFGLSNIPVTYFHVKSLFGNRQRCEIDVLLNERNESTKKDVL
jgi:hypothetical protein